MSRATTPLSFFFTKLSRRRSKRPTCRARYVAVFYRVDMHVIHVSFEIAVVP